MEKFIAAVVSFFSPKKTIASITASFDTVVTDLRNLHAEAHEAIAANMVKIASLEQEIEDHFHNASKAHGIAAKIEALLN